ncbi:hypothetical protein BDR06DRAFT_1037389 [Suillus hirtellus]|nr:hypothetical protein BDR06DRAFT_1037389 [Suillus hirtellus]
MDLQSIILSSQAYQAWCIFCVLSLPCMVAEGRPTRMRPPPGYYSALNKGETATFAATLHQLDDRDDEGLTR